MTDMGYARNSANSLNIQLGIPSGLLAFAGLRGERNKRKVIDDGQCVILVLLDLSAAFDTVDHIILLDRLHRRFGIKGKAIAWLHSYLLERKQFVCVDNKRSSSCDLTCRVPTRLSAWAYVVYYVHCSACGSN